MGLVLLAAGDPALADPLTSDDPGRNLSWDALWPLMLLLAGGGLAAGLLAGFFGVGGGIIIVPVLFTIFGQVGVDEAVRMQLAVGTSLATIVPTSIRSLLRHRSHGAVDGGVLGRWILPVLVGTALGTLVAAAVDGPVLTAIFASLAVLLAFYLAFGREDWRLTDHMPGEPWRSFQGVLIGLLSAMMGIGGGVLGVSIMTLHGVAIHRAIGTASGLGLLIALPGTLGFMLAGWGAAGLAPGSLGFVNAPAFLLVLPMTMLSVPIGVHFAHALPRTILRRCFAGFLALMAGAMWLDLLR